METSLIRKARHRVRWQLFVRVVVLVVTVLISLGWWYLTFTCFSHLTLDNVILIQPHEGVVRVLALQHIVAGYGISGVHGLFEARGVHQP